MCSACPRTRLPFDFRQLPRARICAGSCDFRMPFHELRCLFRNTATVYTISCCGPPPENSEGKSTPVLSNYPDLESVVKPFGIPFHQFLDEGEQNQAGKKPIGTAGGQSDRSRVLARDLQVLSGEFLSPCPNRIINIHGWFLTAFVGARPCHRARYGAHQPPRYCRGFDSQGARSRENRARPRRTLSLESRVLPYGRETGVFDWAGADSKRRSSFRNQNRKHLEKDSL
jgi:hypothetical protein